MPKLVKKLSDNGPTKGRPHKLDLDRIGQAESWRKIMNDLAPSVKEIIFCDSQLSEVKDAALNEFRLAGLLLANCLCDLRHRDLSPDCYEHDDDDDLLVMSDQVQNFHRRANAIRLVPYLGGPEVNRIRQDVELATTDLIVLVTDEKADREKTAAEVRRLLVERAAIR